MKPLANHFSNKSRSYYEELKVVYNNVFKTCDVSFKNKLLWRLGLLPKFSEWSSLLIALREFSNINSEALTFIRSIDYSVLDDSKKNKKFLFQEIFEVFVRDFFIHEFYNKKYLNNENHDIEEAALVLLINNFSYKKDLVSFLEMAGLGKNVYYILEDKNIPSEWCRTLLT